MRVSRNRRLAGAVIVAVTLGAVACSDRHSAVLDDTISTPEMRRELSNDLRIAESQLREVEESIDAALGPELTIRLLPLRDAFNAFRKQQCERLKNVFKDGTYGPVLELECLIHLADSRREFLEAHYGFAEKLGASRRVKRTATATQ